uniref:CYLIP-Lyc-3 n=1 Tax=Lychas buchari TaxID=1330406 RepID=T1E6Y8_9SCOR
MNKRILLVIFIVTLLVVDEVNSFSFRKAKGLFKKAWKSKLAKKLRAKGMKALKIMLRICSVTVQRKFPLQFLMRFLKNEEEDKIVPRN